MDLPRNQCVGSRYADVHFVWVLFPALYQREWTIAVLLPCERPQQRRGYCTAFQSAVGIVLYRLHAHIARYSYDHPSFEARDLSRDSRVRFHVCIQALRKSVTQTFLLRARTVV